MKINRYTLLALGLLVCLPVAYWFSNRPAILPDATAHQTTSNARAVTASPSSSEAPEMPRTKSAVRPDNAARTGKLDDDFDPANYQRRPMGDGTSAPTGAAIAYVQIPSTNRRAALVPNSIGEYEAQPTLTQETVGVRLRIEDVQPGTPVSVVILDGGSFPDGSGPSKIVKVSSDSQIAFRFTTSSNTGFHRVRVLPSGGSPRILDFNASES